MNKKIKKVLRYLPYLLHSIWFNFHYLPFNQAIWLPILLYKPQLIKCKGKLSIDAPIETGMIELGIYQCSLYPNKGIVIELRGNLVFKGKCIIGNNSNISTGENSTLILGSNFVASTTLKLVCYSEIKFSDNVRVGWNNTFCDTDFHSSKKGNIKSKGYAPIEIGAFNWFAMNCTTLKGTSTPNSCIIGTQSLLTKNYSKLPEKCLIAGQPAKFIREDIYRDLEDDIIEYQ